jgi:hypothetical protein
MANTAAAASGGNSGSAAAPPTEESDAVEPPVDKQALEQLQEMGFPRNRCVRALYTTGKSTGTFDLSTALEWLSNHESDEGIDEPLLVSKRARTGESPEDTDSQADDVATSHMTPEDKKQYIKAKLAQRRAAKEAEAKADARAQELARRSEGQGMVAAKEEFETKQRRLVREAQAREKKAALDERERLRKSLAQDKLEKLSDQYGGIANVPAEKAKPLRDLIAGVNPVDAMPYAERMESATAKIARHKVGDAGLKSLKTLRKLIGNALEQPDEEKFRRVNLGNRVIKERITTIAGGIMFLVACGFERPSADADEMLLREDVGVQRLGEAVSKLDAALAKM